jgi:hypothetical protein
MPIANGLNPAISHPITNFQIMTVQFSRNIPIISKKFHSPAKEIGEFRSICAKADFPAHCAHVAHFNSRELSVKRRRPAMRPHI